MNGLEISTKAKIKLEAGGADESNNEEKGKILTIEGDSKFSVLSGDGESKKQFLEEFAKHLPVGIEGSGVEPQTQSSASMLDGRVEDVLKARRGEPSDLVRRPVTCGFVTKA